MGLKMRHSGDARKSSMHLSDVVLHDIVSRVCWFSDLYEIKHFVKHNGEFMKWSVTFVWRPNLRTPRTTAHDSRNMEVTRN